MTHTSLPDPQATTRGEDPPTWIEAGAGFNLVAWQDRFYALPEELGPVYLDPEDFLEASGVRVASSLLALREELGLEAPPDIDELEPMVAELCESLDPAAVKNIRFLIDRVSRTPAEQSALAEELRAVNNLPGLLGLLAERQTARIQSYFLPGRPTVAIYFPSAAYREHAGQLAPRLRERGLNAFTLVGTVCDDRYEAGDQVFYGGHNLVDRMDFVDLFLVPTLMYGLPERSRKLLLVHDIYDSPVGDPAEFRKLLLEFDACALPSRFVVELFKGIVSLPDPEAHRSKPLHLIPAGYLKLDRLMAHFETRRREEKTIIYAPTVTGLDFQDVISLPQHGGAIIDAVLSGLPDYRLIFRPHPHSLPTEVVRELAARFSPHPRFELDESASFYMDNYSRAALMITDISGTAYTYSFATQRPVVFFSPNEAEVQRRYGALQYVEDRGKVGRVIENVADLTGAIQQLLEDRDSIRGRIQSYRNSVIFNVGQAEDCLVRSVEALLRSEVDPAWVTLS